MDVNPNALRLATVNTLKEIELQIDEINSFAMNRGLELHQVKDHNGAWVMPPLLLAKTQCLHTLVMLNENRR